MTIRTSFVTLEDVTSQVGRPLHAAVEGDAAAGKNAHGVFAAKDESGNLAYLRLVDGKLSITTEGVVASLDAQGSVAGSTSFVDVASITLTASMSYRKIGFVDGCFRDAEFKIVHDNNGTPSIIAQGMLVGAGQYSLAEVLDNLQFTAGATGTQILKIQAKNLNAPSAFHATLTVDEIQ